MKELLETVEHLKSRGINLISLEEKLDTSSAAGELVFHVFGAIAHFERRLISERTRDGIAAARKRGNHPGRPKLDEETVSALHKLVAAGMTPRVSYLLCMSNFVHASATKEDDDDDHFQGLIRPTS